MRCCRTLAGAELVREMPLTLEQSSIIGTASAGSPASRPMMMIEEWSNEGVGVGDWVFVKHVKLSQVTCIASWHAVVRSKLVCTANKLNIEQLDGTA